MERLQNEGANTITHPYPQTALAKAITGTDPGRAEQIAAEVTVTSQSWTTALPFLPRAAAIAEELTGDFGHTGRYGPLHLALAAR